MSVSEVERVARAICIADGEDPDAFHTREERESGLCLTDHAIPLWRQADYMRRAKAAIAALPSYEGMREALTVARKAIASLERDALGEGVYGHDPHDGAPLGYPIRDELLSMIDLALASIETDLARISSEG